MNLSNIKYKDDQLIQVIINGFQHLDFVKIDTSQNLSQLILNIFKYKKWKEPEFFKGIQEQDPYKKITQMKPIWSGMLIKKEFRNFQNKLDKFLTSLATKIIVDSKLKNNNFSQRFSNLPWQNIQTLFQQEIITLRNSNNQYLELLPQAPSQIFYERRFQAKINDFLDFQSRPLQLLTKIIRNLMKLIYLQIKNQQDLFNSKHLLKQQIGAFILISQRQNFQWKNLLNQQIIKFSQLYMFKEKSNLSESQFQKILQIIFCIIKFYKQKTDDANAFELIVDIFKSSYNSNNNLIYSLYVRQSFEKKEKSNQEIQKQKLNYLEFINFLKYLQKQDLQNISDFQKHQVIENFPELVQFYEEKQYHFEFLAKMNEELKLEVGINFELFKIYNQWIQAFLQDYNKSFLFIQGVKHFDKFINYYCQQVKETKQCNFYILIKLHLINVFFAERDFNVNFIDFSNEILSFTLNVIEKQKQFGKFFNLIQSIYKIIKKDDDHNQSIKNLEEILYTLKNQNINCQLLKSINLYQPTQSFLNQYQNQQENKKKDELLNWDENEEEDEMHKKMQLDFKGEKE